MARGVFGTGAGDFVYSRTAGGLVRFSAATLTLWEAEAGGDQVTDLVLGGQPVTEIPVGDDGDVPTFSGPDGVTTLWASARVDGTSRVQLLAAAAGSGGAAAVAHDFVAEFDFAYQEVLL